MYIKFSNTEDLNRFIYEGMLINYNIPHVNVLFVENLKSSLAEACLNQLGMKNWSISYVDPLKNK